MYFGEQRWMSCAGEIVYYSYSDMEAIFAILRGNPDACGPVFRGRAPESWDEFLLACERAGIREVAECPRVMESGAYWERF